MKVASFRGAGNLATRTCAAQTRIQLSHKHASRTVA